MTSLFDITVDTFDRTLGAMTGILKKGREHLMAEGADLTAALEASLHPDMKPLRFQIVSVGMHSLGALQAVRDGVFAVSNMHEGVDYAGLEKLVSDARAGLKDFSREMVEGFEGKDIEFRFGEKALPFTAEGFLLSISLPNFYFHAATAYDILRYKGVPLAKSDFLGQIRMKA